MGPRSKRPITELSSRDLPAAPGQAPGRSDARRKAWYIAIRSPLERASSEIRAFLEDLLGEQAAAVVMAVGDRAAMGSATPGARPRINKSILKLLSNAFFQI